VAIWLGQIITEEGIGNGVLDHHLWWDRGLDGAQHHTNLETGGIVQLFVFVLVTVLTVAVIVLVQEGQRRIPVQYGKRVRAMRGNRMVMVGGQSTHVPLRVNSAGMIPLIFASSFLIFPGTIASYFVNSPTSSSRPLRMPSISSSTGIAGRTGSCTSCWSSRSLTFIRT